MFMRHLQMFYTICGLLPHFLDSKETEFFSFYSSTHLETSTNPLEKRIQVSNMWEW